MANQEYTPFTGKLDAAPEFESFDGTLDGEKPKGKGMGDFLRDGALSLAKGVVAVPEAAVGLADIATGGRVGKFLENEGGAVGFRPKQAKEFLGDLHTDPYKDQQRQFQEADGIIDKAGVALSNPSMIANAVVESGPSMLAGGAVGRGVLAAGRGAGAIAAPATAAQAARQAALAGAAGEGITMAGSAAEQIRQETPDGLLTPMQTGAVAATGLIGGVVGAGSGLLARRLGIGEVDTMLTQGIKGEAKQFADDAAAAAANPLAAQVAKSLPRQVIEGAITEGLLEELPQSVAEQVLQNLALNKPWADGLEDAIVMGALTGGAMGAGAAGLHGYRAPHAAATGQAADTAQPGQGAATEPATPGLDRMRSEWQARMDVLAQQEQGEPAVPQTAPPDGAAALAAQQAEQQQARLDAQAQSRAVQSPDDEIYQSTGAVDSAPAPIRPSEAMGLDPSAGSMSAAAALAVDSGATDQMAQMAQAQAQAEQEAKGSKKGEAAPQGAMQQAAQAGSLRTDEDGVILDGGNAASTAFPTYEDAHAYVMGQRRNGANVTGLPIPAEGGGFKVAMKGTPEYQQGETLRAERMQAERQAKASAKQQAKAPQEQPAQAPAATETVAQATSLQAITAKQIPAMTDGELNQAIEHYGPEHKRTAKLQKEVQRRAAESTTTPQGVTHGPQANQAQQTGAQPTQAGATTPAGAATPAASGLTGGAAQGKAPRATPEQLADAQSRWQRMPTAERQALASRTDVKPVLRKNLHGAQWENLNVDVQRKLTDAMALGRPVGAAQSRATDQVFDTRKAAIQEGERIGGNYTVEPINGAGPLGQHRLVIRKQADALASQIAPEPLSQKLPPTDIRPGDKVAVDGEAYTVTGPLKEGGKAVGVVASRDSDTDPLAGVRQVFLRGDEAIRARLAAQTAAPEQSAAQSVAQQAKEPTSKSNPETARRAERIAGALSSGGYVQGSELRANNGMALMQLDENELASIPESAIRQPRTPAQMQAAATAGKTTAGPSAKPADKQFAGNKIFTADAVAAARERMKKKLGTLNSGMDPELMMDGMTIAGAYIESGMRSFGQYAKAMVADMGDGVKPYLLSFWEAARHFPGVDTQGMTSVADSAREHAALITPEVQEQAAEAVGTVTAKPTKRTRKTGATGDMVLTQDWGVEHINGYAEGSGMREAGNATKDAFLKEAANYLKAVAAQLAESGFGPHAERNGKPGKAVGVNESGVAGSGDVSLTMQHPETGTNVYVTIGGTTIAGMVPSTASGIAIMYRTATGSDRYAANGGNTWAPVDLSATDLAALVSKRMPGAVVGSTAAIEGQSLTDLAPAAIADTVQKADTDNKDAQNANPDTPTQPEQQPTVAAGPGVQDGKPGKVRGNAGGVRGSNTQPAAGDAGRGSAKNAGTDYVPAAQGLTRTGSWFETAKRNIDLIELAIKIDAEKRPATPQEQEQLSKYVGFGASAIRNDLFPIPNDYAKKQDPSRLIWPNMVRDARWKPLAERIEALPREWQQSILQSSQYAHYTSEGIIRNVWGALERMGFKGGNVFEPGMGIGSFAMLMPNEVRAESRYTGIEFDGPTALIAGLLSPQQNMIHGDFIKRKFPKNFFDVNVGNPPFAQTKIYGDPDYAKNGFMLHDFFFAKGIDLVRPGGLQVFVTSKGTMDKQSDKARKYLSERADLLGAIRLPSTAFEGNAGTSVVTDVIFLKKRAPGEAPAGRAWGNVATVETPDGPVVVNEYFAANPHMVLGQQRISGNVDDEGRRINSNGMGGEKYTVVSYDKTPAELDAKFAQAIQSLPAGTYAQPTEAQAKEKPKAVDFDPAVKREGVIYLGKDGALMRVDEGVGKNLAAMVNLSAKEQAWFKSYVGLRDQVQAARFDQLNDGPWEKSLAALNKAYDAFRKEHGPIKDFRVMVRKSTDEDGKIVGTESRIFKNRKLYREDYDNALITSLEEITEDGDIVKAPFLQGRTIGKPVERVVRSIGDALAVSLDEIGSLSLEDVGKRLGLSREEAIEALGDQVYLAPSGAWQLSDEYLSGDVVAKLEEAEQAARLQPELRRNVQALKDVQPEKLGPSQISAKLGASWIPESQVNEFADEIGAGAVTFDPRTETWQVDGGNLRSQRSAGAEYGTAARSPSELLEAVLNSRTIKITQTVDKKTVTDEAATTAANEMAKKIKDKFKGWVWTDTDRSTELVERYNKQFNNIAPRRFDGAHLTLPGVSLRFKLHPHQLRAIWRMVQTGNTYLAHAVGAGKTIEMIAGGMEQKRLGLIKKPIYVVPNHMLEQFSNEFMELYPMANIMVADDENFSPERRKAFVAAATLNNPDAIVITHDAFQRIGVKEESVAPIRDEILADLEIELSETAKGNDTRVRRGQLEQQIEAVKQRFDRIIGAGAKDSTVKFEDMGVDFVFADEAHVFRKLDFHTAQQIKGIDPNGSKRALDMYVKTRILDGRNPGRSMVFASGTPVTNTMGELYTIMRFFAGDALDKGGISTFDAWARQFGEVAPALEPNAAGKYELVERFAKFDNVPELMSRVRQFMDVLTSDNLGALVKRPDIKGGKPNLNITAPNKALQEYMQGELARRIEISKAWKPSKDEPNNPDPIVAIITDGRFAALDPRFFGGKLEEGETSLLMDMGKGVVESYHATKGNVYKDKAGNDEPVKGSTQLVFYNLGFGEQSQKSRGFNSRATFTKILTDGGIPRGEIYWFDDANTDAKKEAVFKDVRNGKVKVLIGSAKKMGTGVNVQKRLAVLHYQDPPWFPADVEQPHGRIIRQGNQNAEGAIEWYTTKGTYQSTMWQMVGRKQRFIDQAFTGDKNLRSMEDMGEASLFEQAAAVASGDPRAIQLAGLRQDVERFERLQASHASEQINVASALRNAQWGMDSAKKRIATYSKAFAAIGESYFSFSEGKVGGAAYNKPGEFGQAIKDAFNKTAANAVMAEKPVQDKAIATLGDAITIYMDQVVDTTGNAQNAFDLAVSFGGMTLDMGTASGMGADVDAAGLARRVFNKINSVDQDLRAAKGDLVRNEVDTNKLRKKLGAPFEYQQEMAEKYAELKRLEAELQAEGEAPAKPAITTDGALTPQADGESTNRQQTGAPEANAVDVVFSRSTRPGAGFTPAARMQAVQAVEQTANAIRSAWANGPQVVVAFDMDDPVVPDSARRADLKQRSGGARGAPEGFYHQGKVYLMASRLNTINDAARVLFHEALGHHGLRGAFGGQLAPILNQIATMRRADVDAKIKEYGLRGVNRLDRRAAAEEVLAEMAQATPNIGFVRRAVAAIRTWLRQNVPGFKSLGLSDNEIIRSYILPARRFVERGGPGGGGLRTQAAFSRGAEQSAPMFSRSKVEGVAARMGDAIKSVTAANIKERAGWKLTDWLGMGLQALGRRQLVDIYGDVLPLDVYNRLAAQMEADKNEVGAGADQLATAWGKLKDERQLAELMHDATLAQIDPEKGHAAGDDQARYQILRGRFDALTPEAKQVYRDARGAYQGHHANVRAAIKERIERSELKGERKAELLKQMDDEFFKSVKGVYFPLSRFGQYVVAVKGGDGKVHSVGRAETKPEAEALRRSMLAAFPAAQGYKVDRVILNKEFIATRDAVGRGFMTELYGVLDKQDMDAAQRAELEDTLGQLYLSALPDLSWAKHGIHRKGTPGFSQDARRAYAQNMFHGARYLAKLRYSDLMQDELAAMQEHTDNWKDVDGFNQNNAQRVVDEFNKRHESMMNPKGNPISTAMTSFGFIFYLGLSPASAMVNLSQTALVAYPVMGAKWGFGKASAALLKASEQALKGKNDITSSLTADERQAYDEAVRSGTIDVTMAHDLAGIAQGEDAGVMWKIRPVMKAASFMFHHAERFNRQVTFIAAYRLARETGVDHKTAFQEATKATYDGHFDYSSGNRPRIMQGNVARVVTLFKQFGQNMVYTIARSAYQSVKGTEAEKKEARKVFAGLLVSHGLAAGALGLPMVTTLLAAASMLGGGDDEPWDAQVALQNLLADAFGQKTAEVMAHGLSRLTPWDVSGRVGLDRLILPDVQEGLEGQRLGEAAMAAALGPVAGIGINMLKGLQQMSEGQFERGLESMVPTAVRGPMKAMRFASEGVQDKSGISILDEVSPAATIGQALGFSPSEARNAQEGKSAIVQHDRALGERRQQLVTRYAMAAMAKDQEGQQEAREAVARFNEKNPARRILPMHLMASVRGRQNRIDQAQDGVYLPKNRRDAMEAGRFALGD